MFNSLYHRLAFSNIKRNKRTYLPFAITCMCTTMMYFVMNLLCQDEGLMQMREEITVMLEMGTTVIMIFSAIFLFYTNCFLMKQRKKELGLYQILGMEKRHIAKVLLFESLLLLTTTITAGLFGGAIISKLIYLLLLKLLTIPVPMNFGISGVSVWSTIIVFVVIHGGLLLSNFYQIQTANPISLLKGGQVGEKEPKSNLLLAIFGVVCLSIGYGIAIIVESPLLALYWFLVAVIFVMAGTYALFTAGSVVLLKLLRKNKAFYYQTKHFVSVSGMIYRMKQNAVGLANICILSSAVLVMISSTISLYMGKNDVIRSRFPQNMKITIDKENESDNKTALNFISNKAIVYNVGIEGLISYRFSQVYTTSNGNKMVPITEGMKINAGKSSITLVPLEDYNRISGQTEQLEENEVMIYAESADYEDDMLYLNDKELKVKNTLVSFPGENKKSSSVINRYFVVMKDVDEITTLHSDWKEKNAESLQFMIGFDLSGEKAQKVEFSEAVWQYFSARDDIYVESAQLSEQSFYATYGGLFFLGLFLGTLFLMATVLIIYYKQVSEGIDDKERFIIMQKVGMSTLEIRRSIRSQILIVFFLPLAAAALHILFAFQVITKLLTLMEMYNTYLFFVCTAATVGVFIVIYAGVYAITARVYYKIVK